MAQQRSTYTWNGGKAAALLRDATVKGLTQWAELVLQKSNERVPLDEGTLERSGTASVDPQALEAAVSYDTPYAVEQHELPPEVHRNGRQWKYLEQPWIESMKWAAPLIQKQIRRATK